MCFVPGYQKSQKIPENQCKTKVHCRSPLHTILSSVHVCLFIISDLEQKVLASGRAVTIHAKRASIVFLSFHIKSGVGYLFNQIFFFYKRRRLNNLTILEKIKFFIFYNCRKYAIRENIPEKENTVGETQKNTVYSTIKYILL